MAKYIYKNTHFFATVDPKRIIKMSLKVLYAGWGPTACYSYAPANSHACAPAHACGPISHAWLKNVSCCSLAWHNFQKYVNSDPCKERKPCVKWINDNTFLAISDFVDTRFLDNFAFGRLRTSSEDFGLLRESSEMIVSSSKIPALLG